MAYQDEVSIFFLTQDPVSTQDTEAHEIHVKLKKKIPKQSIIRLQRKEFAGIIKKVEKNKEKLSHLYILDDEGVLKRIVRDNNMKIEVIVVPRDLTRTLLFEVHEALAHLGQLKVYMFLR